MSPFVKCQSKLAFATKEEARRELSRFRRNKDYRPGQIQVYRCDCCGQYHAGRKR